MSAEGRIFDTATLLRAYLGAGSPYAAQIVRYLNAAHTCAYTGLSSKTYNESFFKLIALQHGLLDTKEAEAILKINVTKGGAYRELVMWAVQSLKDVQKKDMLTAVELQSIHDQILRFRGALASLYDYDFQPVPFVYWNMLTWLLVVFCPMNAYVLALMCHEVWWFGFLAFIFVNFSLLGLMILATWLNRPYGEEITDFAVYHFLHFTCTSSREIINSENHFSPDGEAADFLLGEWGAGKDKHA